MPDASTGAASDVSVVVSDEQDDQPVDVERWRALAHAVLSSEGRCGELTVTFVDVDEMTALNTEHMGGSGPTDVLSFPLDADLEPGYVPAEWGPLLLGDIVVCPAIAAGNAANHAGTVDDELALLVVHGILHVLGHDHADPEETAVMRARELEHLVAHHWHGPAPSGFTQEQQSA